MSGNSRARIALFAALMLLVGLLLPAGLEWLADRSVGAEQAIPVEAIDYQAGSGTLIDILNLINSSAEVTQQEIKEGYNYNRQSALVHAKELLLSFLTECGFENAESWWAEYLGEAKFSCDGLLIAVPDFPTPWSAILWTVNIPYVDGIEISVVFDDATGAMLMEHILLEKGQETFAAALRDDGLAQRCAQAYVKGLDGLETAELSLAYADEDDVEQTWLFSVIDSEGARVDVMMTMLCEAGHASLDVEPMGNGYENGEWSY